MLYLSFALKCADEDFFFFVTQLRKNTEHETDKSDSLPVQEHCCNERIRRFHPWRLAAEDIAPSLYDPQVPRKRFE